MIDSAEFPPTTLRHELLAELDAARSAYHELLGHVSADAWQRPSANPAWNVRQLAFHITTALRFLPADVRLIRSGRTVKPPMALFHFANKWYTRLAARRHDAASLLALYDRNHARTVSLLATLTDADLALAADYPAVDANLTGGRRSIADLIRYAARHVSLHADELRAAAAAPSLPAPPTGIARLFYRAPIFLYRAGLGGLFGGRFLLLNHVGRRSGLPRRAVVEVVRHDAATGAYVIASGFGEKSDWLRNLRQTPTVTIQVGRGTLAVRATRLTGEEGSAEMADYARRHPRAARALSRYLGLPVDGTEAGYRACGAVIPFVRLDPHRPSPRPPSRVP